MSGYTGQVPDTLTPESDWQQRGACRGMDLDVFFSSATELEAKGICRSSCPVRDECLKWIMEVERGSSVFHRDGVVAGLNGRERTILDPTAEDPPEPKASAPGEKPAAAPRKRKKPPAKPRPGGRPLAPCGTDAAYRRHVRRHEPIDKACRTEHTRVNREKAYAQDGRKVHAAWALGKTDAEIAKATGLKPLRVYRVRTRLGLLPNRQSLEVSS